jgi:two-component system aerobic respiration control protein ArcA
MDTKRLIEKIEKIKRERMRHTKVVDLSEFRDTKRAEHRRNLLVIDDDETMRSVLKRIFESEGYKVYLASDGTHLSEILEDTPLELIMLDINLPWVDGYELCKLMKEHDDLRNVPVIFVSGKTSEIDIKRGFDAGCDDYITKPFNVDEITDTVKTLLKIK